MSRVWMTKEEADEERLRLQAVLRQLNKTGSVTIPEDSPTFRWVTASPYTLCIDQIPVNGAECYKQEIEVNEE